MISKHTLVGVADQYREALGGLTETTLSHRLFGDTKKLGSLRGDADITLGRFSAAMRRLASLWPASHPLPDDLRPYLTSEPLSPVPPAGQPDEDAA